MNLLVLLSAVAVAASSADAPSYHAEQIFPPVDRQTHAPGIVECPNGDLLASWYGDRPQSDSAVFGARLKRGETNWSPPFVLADRRGFPDCNTCMMIDRQHRLWLFWPTIVADSWETCLMNFRVAANYEQPGPPRWECEGLILLKPENFRDEALRLLGNRKLRPPRGAKGGPEVQREAGRISVPAARLGAAVQADDPAQRPDPAATLFGHVFHLDHGGER